MVNDDENYWYNSNCIDDKNRVAYANLNNERWKNDCDFVLLRIRRIGSKII